MKRTMTAAAALLLGGICFAAGELGATEAASGEGRWAVKTSIVETAPARHEALTALLALRGVPGVAKDDPRYRSSRIANFDNPAHLQEGDIITTTGWLHVVASETDGDYSLQISASPTDGNDCIILAIPKDDPEFVASDTLRAQAAASRAWIRDKLLHGNEPSPRGSVMTHPVYVSVTGQLFYDDAHIGDAPRGKKNMTAATPWELHPVTAIAFAPVPR